MIGQKQPIQAQVQFMPSTAETKQQAGKWQYREQLNYVYAYLNLNGDETQTQIDCAAAVFLS